MIIMKIGLIQTRGLGDIVIAIPVAMHFISLGHKVYWPIDSEFIDSFSDTFPDIEFLPIYRSRTGDSTAEYFYYQPLQELTKLSCDNIYCLYSHLTGFNLGNERLRESLTFDAYKYAITNTPFHLKWNFKPRRNAIRESNLFKILNLDPTEKFNIIQDAGSNLKVNLTTYIENKKIRNIFITPLTENIFDWLGVIERCESAYFLDSVYSNIVEQMNLCANKSILLRSPAAFTPILKNNWKYIQ